MPAGVVKDDCCAPVGIWSAVWRWGGIAW
ncbi:MAG: hypothetical protein ACI9OJ_002496, partial [Myxococcota bacterium]